MKKTLHFRKDKTFTILQFTDTHFSDGGEEDQRTLRLIEKILDLEKPDLVILTGDVISGGESPQPEEAWRMAVLPMEERKIPWASVLGNHDDEGSLTRDDLMLLQKSFSYCLSEPGPKGITGVGNYVLKIFSFAQPTLSAVLYCLDSGSYAPPKVGGYAWIAHDQIAWYLSTAREIAREYSTGFPSASSDSSKIPALAFFHIPLPEYNEVWDLYPCKGYKYEPVCSPKINSGFFSALYEVGDVLGTFVGHDHINDFEGNLLGIRLCYGRGSGFNTYGREGFLRGARIIRLYEGKRSFDTWIRLEDGTALLNPPKHLPEKNPSF